MKKLFNLPMIFAMLSFLSSCQKDEVIPVPEVKVITKNVVKTNESGNMTSITHNADGTIKTMTWETSGMQNVRTFTYAANEIYYEQTRNSVKVQDVKFILSGGKIITADYTFYNANGSVNAQVSEMRSYNSLGQYIECTYSNGARTTFTYNANGDLQSFTNYSSVGVKQSTSEFQYLSTPEKSRNFNYFNHEGLGKFEFPFASHLLSHRKNISFPSGNVDFDGDFSYEFDADGFVVKGMYASTITPGNAGSWIYEYNN